MFIKMSIGNPGENKISSSVMIETRRKLIDGMNSIKKKLHLKLNIIYLFALN